MATEEFDKDVLGIFREVLRDEKVVDFTTDLHSIEGWNSLSMLECSIRLEDELGITALSEHLVSAQTVRQFLDGIKSA